MGHLTVLSLCLIGFTAHIVKASYKYKECTVYVQGESKPSYPTCRFCITSSSAYTEKEYCREYSCARNNCSDSVNPTHDCCRSCPGTCNYAGRVYYVNDTFSCLDGINKCTCTSTGTVIGTEIAYTIDTLCEPRHHGACKLYALWEQKARNMERLCLNGTISGNSVTACKEYGCNAPLICDKPKKNNYDDCYSCPGTCNYGGRGKQYKVGDSFKCIDGVNTCTCQGTGIVGTTYIAQNIDSMCNEYGDNCVVYDPADVPDPDKCRYCQRGHWNPWARYCLEYTCAKPGCESPVETPNQCCDSCPGTCNYGGRVYNVNDTWTCLDAVNSCFCVDTGTVGQTKVYGPVEAYCFNDY